MSGTIIIKTAEELDIMRQAGRKAAEVLRIVCAAVKPGVMTARFLTPDLPSAARPVKCEQCHRGWGFP